MDPKQRLQLNFGGGFNTDRNYEPNNTRVFPTTPSTYPQPLYGNQGTASTPNPYAQQGPSPYAAAPPASAGGYFPPVGDNQRPLYQQQYQNQNYPSQQSNLAAPQPSYQQRQGPGGYNANNDPTSGLAHQFQNQNLGAPARQGSPFGRQPSPNARLYPNSQAPQSRSQQSHVSSQRMAQTPPATMLTPPTQDASGRAFNEDPPEKNPEQYSANVIKRAEGLSKFVESYFRENVTRARDRNQRYVYTLQITVSNPLITIIIVLRICRQHSMTPKNLTPPKERQLKPYAKLRSSIFDFCARKRNRAIFTPSKSLEKAHLVR